MKTNIGSIDKAIRIFISVAICLLLVEEFFTGILSIIGMISVFLFLIITSFLGYCPFYNVMNINTKKNLNDKAYNDFKKQFNYPN